jgi:uncharacterized membrane protein
MRLVMYGNHMGGGGWAVSIIATLIIVGLIVAAIIWLASDRREDQRASDVSAGEILDRCLATGEITSERYDELCELLVAATRDQQPPRPVSTPG